MQFEIRGFMDDDIRFLHHNEKNSYKNKAARRQWVYWDWGNNTLAEFTKERFELPSTKGEKVARITVQRDAIEEEGHGTMNKLCNTFSKLSMSYNDSFKSRCVIR